MKSPNSIFVSVLVLLLCNFSQADPSRTCRIIFPERPQDAPKLLFLLDGKNTQEVALPSMNLSPIYKIAPGAIQLKLLTTNVEDDKDVPADAPSVEIPADYTDFLLIVSSDPNNKTAPVKLEAVNLDSEDFKVGQVLWNNRTDKTIEGKLGDQILSLGPVSSKIVNAPVSDKGVATSGYYTASFTYQADDKGEFEPITEQQWWHDANSRHLGFILDTGGKLPVILIYRDFRDP